MIENIDRLSCEDKLFMIHNPKCFSLPTSSTISFNRETWMKDIELKLHPEVINKAIIDRNTICDISTISYVTRGKMPDYIENSVTKRLVQIVDMPCETKENINDILSMFGFVLNVINDSLRDSKEYKIGVVKYFFLRLFLWKLQAHEIYVNTTTDIAPGDKLLKEYYFKTLRWLIPEMMCYKSSYDKIAVVLYQICKYLYIDEKSSQLKILADSVCTVHSHLEYEELMGKTAMLLKEQVDALSVINNIADRNATNMTEIIIDSAKRKIEDNYEKNKISSKLNNGGLCIGDNVFDNGFMLSSKLLMELEMLSEDRLKDYIGENKYTTFEIPENDIGYLKLREKLPICKIMTKDDGFHTLTRYEDKSYLLFKIIGDPKCYGISFPSDFGGGRKVVVFDVPTNYEYVLSM